MTGTRQPMARVATALLIGLAPVTLCGCVPDRDSKITTAYVERTQSGFQVSLRPCDTWTIRTVEVRRYNTERVIWSAKVRSDTLGVRTLPLFEKTSGFTYQGKAPPHPIGRYDVSAAGVGVVFDADLPVGSVAYPGSETPVTRDQYQGLSDSQFDC